MTETRKLTKVSGILFSLAVAFSLVFGKKVGSYPQQFQFEWSDILDILFAAFFIGVITFFAINGVKYWSNGNIAHTKLKKSKVFAFFVVFLLIVWLPYFWTLRPAMLSPDSIDILSQVRGLYQIRDHHPVTYTLLIKVFLEIGYVFGSVEAGLTIFTLFQMILGACVIGASLTYIAQRSNVILALPGLLFFSLLPIYGVAMMTLWKDVLFSIGITAFSLVLILVVESNGELLSHKSAPFLIVLIGFWVILFRHNGIYLFAGTAVVLFVVYRKFVNKKIIITAVCTVLAFTVGLNTVLTVKNIEKGDFVESVGVPLQQMAATVAWDGNINQEQKEFIEQLMPIESIKSKFSAYFVDPIKFSEEFSKPYLSEHKAEFFKTWLSMLGPNFGDYVKAYMMLTDGYWNITMDNTMSFADTLQRLDENTLTSIGLTKPDDTVTFLGIDVQKMLTQEGGYLGTKVPNMATMMFAGAFAALLFIEKKQQKFCIVLLPIAINWCTIMIAAPTCNDWRYLFSAYMVVPIVLTWAIVCPNRNNSIAQSNSVVQPDIKA